MPIVSLITRAKYLDRAGHVIEIAKTVSSNDARYAEGFRFLDKQGRAYTETGRVDPTSEDDNANDLVSEFNPNVDPIEVVDQQITETKLPGYFTLLRERIASNPIKTSVGAAVVVGTAGYGAYNYRDHGTVLPRRNRRGGDTARAAALFSSLVLRAFG